jgi:hypothetical protein
VGALHKTLFDMLNPAGAIDWSASVGDRSHSALFRGAQSGPVPG